MTNVRDLLADNEAPYPLKEANLHAVDEQIRRRVRGEIPYLVRATEGPTFYRLGDDLCEPIVDD